MKVKFLEPEETQRLRDYLKENRGYSDYYPLIELMLYSGCRADEVMRIRPCDIVPSTKKFTGHWVTIFQGSKGSHGRPIPFELYKTNEICIHMLNRAAIVGLSLNKPFSDLASGSLRKITRTEMIRYHWKNIAAEVFKGSRAETFTLHCLRHTFCKDYYEFKQNLEKTRKMLGHKSLASTQHYLSFIGYESAADDLIELQRGGK